MEIRKGKYRHFKGSEYELIDVARCSETDEIQVIYKPLYEEGGLWVRPAAMFFEQVERDGKVFDRFKYLGE
ncbi:DUF1653 domain-containing protein [Rubritalea marina]|uniref:DUF1653 domain-containing protein n=1 Tax=Rubritalea marina TaxID=361055 RepID=UPI000364A436|nr:DUF1653 domain-containing protein [Rubritalea marina]